MAKYFDIHVKYDYRDCDGYSIGVIADDEKDAVAVAVNNHLLAENDDECYIDNVTEIDYEDYVALTQ